MIDGTDENGQLDPHDGPVWRAAFAALKEGLLSSLASPSTSTLSLAILSLALKSDCTCGHALSLMMRSMPLIASLNKVFQLKVTEKDKDKENERQRMRQEVRRWLQDLLSCPIVAVSNSMARCLEKWREREPQRVEYSKVFVPIETEETSYREQDEEAKEKFEQQVRDQGGEEEEESDYRESSKQVHGREKYEEEKREWQADDEQRRNSLIHQGRQHYA